MPQFVHGYSRSGVTYRSACSRSAATSSAVSTRSVATSMQPTRTSLPDNSPSSSIGTRDPAHSTDTWSIALAATTGRISRIPWKLADWGAEALDAAFARTRSSSCVHVCYGYRARLGNKTWTHGYEEILPHLAKCGVKQYSLECAEPG